MSTLFSKIISGELPAEKVFENERILVIKDKFPAAPVHLLIIPKKAIPNFQSMTEEDLALLPEIGALAQQLAKEFNVENDYRLLTNNGESSGQSIFHLHFHLIGGKKLGPMA